MIYCSESANIICLSVRYCFIFGFNSNCGKKFKKRKLVDTQTITIIDRCTVMKRVLECQHMWKSERTIAKCIKTTPVETTNPLCSTQKSTEI